MPKVRRRMIALDARAGPWQPLGHAQPPPPFPRGFGPPRFTPAQQAANPDKPMTRLVKDVFRLGKWKVWSDEFGRPELWDATPDVLAELVFAHMRSTSRGVAMNLTKSHGDLSTGLVPTDELICPVDEMIVDNGVIWASCYVTPETAKYLRNPACKVSPGIWPDWTDGYGNHYPLRMLHIAVTDNPVIPGQGPFLAMSNGTTSTRNRRNATMDFPTLKNQINDLLKALSDGAATLPADSTEDTINRDLQIVCTSLGITNNAQQQQQEAYDQANSLEPTGLGMANRTRKGSKGRAMFNSHRPRPTDEQCREAARKILGTGGSGSGSSGSGRINLGRRS
jgi:hypothetical protein